MGLLEKWFNIESTPNSPFIIDSKGRKFWIYWIDHEKSSSLKVRYYGKPAGHLNVVWHNDYAELADIVIHDPKLRGNGVGRALLLELFNKAQDRGVKTIIGNIIITDEEQHRGVTKEYLREWYKRQGFEVGSEGDLRVILHDVCNNNAALSLGGNSGIDNL